MTKINKTAKNLQACVVSLDADTLTASVGQTVTLTAKVDPPGTYDVNFKINGTAINPTPIITDSSGMAILPFDTTGRLPGLYDLTVEVINPTPPPPESCVSSPLTVALTTILATCTGITIDSPGPGPITAYIGDIVPISATATVTEQSIVEFRETEFGTRIGSCITPPTGGSCTTNIDTTGAPPGTYRIEAMIGTTPPCVSSPIEVILQFNIIAIAIIPSTTTCTEPCDLTVDITWANNGVVEGSFEPAILVDGIRTPMATEPLPAGANTTHTFSVSGLMAAGPNAATHQICADPNRLPCETITVNPIPCEIVSMSLTSVEPIMVGRSRELRADVSPPGFPPGSYLVDFYDGTELLGSVTSDLSGMAIFIWETTPMTIIGPHHITANASNASSPIPCISPEILIDVLPATGDVCFQSNPAGASIIIDGTPQNGKVTVMSGTVCTPESTVTGLIPGSYTYRLVLAGFADALGSFDISAEQVTIVDVGNLLTYANIISTTLTVDTNDCVAPCTVNGTVSWTNNGDTASDPTDLVITYNGGSTTVAFAVVIGPGETTEEYPFSLPDLAAGTYTVQAFPNSGTDPQTIIVRTPANIIVTAITPSLSTCIEPCDLTVNVTWTNDGGVAGEFIPTINIDDIPIDPAQYTSESLDPGANVTHTFTVTGLMKGLHTICANPGTITDCVTITVEQVAMAGFGSAGMLIIAGLAVGAVLTARKPKI